MSNEDTINRRKMLSLLAGASLALCWPSMANADDDESDDDSAAIQAEAVLAEAAPAVTALMIPKIRTTMTTAGMTIPATTIPARAHPARVQGPLDQANATRTGPKLLSSTAMQFRFQRPWHS
jgi:hypothetical protein